ncbi:MAG: hypothetical protein H0U55_04195, partial [Rubrobacteraceae bacterium]|nr:hypothetical protein [Rubrobacteraceae bacterium]
MSEVDEFYAQFTHHVEQIGSIAAAVAVAGYWKRSFYPPVPETIHIDLDAYVLECIAHFLMADGELDRKEVSLVEKFAAAKLGRDQATNTINFLRGKRKDLLEQCPLFLQAAIRCDEERTTRYG